MYYVPAFFIPAFQTPQVLHSFILGSYGFITFSIPVFSPFLNFFFLFLRFSFVCSKQALTLFLSIIMLRLCYVSHSPEDDPVAYIACNNYSVIVHVIRMHIFAGLRPSGRSDLHYCRLSHKCTLLCFLS